MIVSGGTDRYAAAAAPTTTTTVGNATIMMANLQQQQQQQQQQLQQPQQQLQQPQQPEDFWWWPTQNVDGNGLAQHQQISSSSSLQQQLQQQLDSGSGADEFDSFDLSMLINNATDGYFNDCRLSTAAISATVTVRTNAIDDSDYYAPTTTSAKVTSAEVTTPTQQQMDLQQLLSLCDDLCFFGQTAGNNPATENDVKPTSIFDQEQQQAAAIVTTTTTCNAGRQSKIVTGPATIAAVPSTPTPTGATRDVSGDSTSNTTLLRSLLTATVPALPAVTVTHPRDSAAKVESTTEAVATITTSATKITTDNINRVSAALDNDKKINNNKHRILIEMLRGETNNKDVAVVPTRPTRRRPRSAAFGTDSDRSSNDDDDRVEPSYGGRRRLNGPSPLVDDGPDVQRMDMDDDGLIMYGSPYYSASTSPLWLDHMAAAAAAETTGASPTDFYPCAMTTDHQQEDLNRSRDQRHIMADDDIDNIVDDCCAGSDYCNDYSSIGSGGVFDPDGGYYSVAATEVAYSPSTATEVEYSPPTVAQVQSVTSPLSSCGNSSTTTTTGENGPVGMMERMCWKTAEGTATDDDYYTYSNLLTAMMEAEAVASSNDDAASDCCSSADTVGSSCISSSSSGSSCSSNNITTISGNHISGNGDNNTISLIDDSTTDSDGSDTTLVQSQLQQLATCTTSTAASVTATVPPMPATTTSSTSSSQHIHLWQFLKELLMASTAAAEHTASVEDDSDAPPAQATSTTAEYSPSTGVAASATNLTTANLTTANRQQQQQMIRWLDRQQGVFKIEDSQAVARLWGRRKNRPAMNYDKLSRSLRQYYKKGIMQKTERSQRLVYQFCHPYNA